MSNHPCGPEHGFRVDCIKYYHALEKRQKELEAENERLRKAGDAMYEECENFQGTWKLREAWNAAKEGKPSA